MMMRPRETIRLAIRLTMGKLLVRPRFIVSALLVRFRPLRPLRPLGVTVAWTLLLASSLVLQAGEKACPVADLQLPKEQFHIYLLIGQSNMSGRGQLSAEDRSPVPDVYVLDASNRWTAAAHPLHFDKPKIAGVGLGIDFAKQMLLSDPDIKVGLVPCAVGGTQLRKWSKGGELYNAAVARTRLAGKCGTLQGILWHQGEGDSHEKLARTYGKRLAELISDLRNDLDDPALPFVLGEIGEFRRGVKGRSDIVIRQQRSLPKHVAHCACVSAQGLSHQGDFSHFDADSLRKFGVRYAVAMKSLQTQRTDEMVAQSRAVRTGKLSVKKPSSAATADGPRSSIVIGQSLVDTRNSKPGELKSPFGVDFDRVGNMFIVELSGGRVHKLDTIGNFTTIAGDGSKGYSGDGGPARAATFNGMHNVAVTPSGDVYIADSWNHCIRKIDSKSGMITTFAGTGKAGFSGDGGQASQAAFNFLMCVSLNPTHDKIYVADLKNLRVRVIDLETGIVNTVAGNGEKGIPKDGAVATESPLVDPRAVAVDSRGNVYLLERSGPALRVVTPDGKIRTVAGTGKQGEAEGPALEAAFNSPKHIAVDLADNVIIADDQNKRICKYDPRQGTVISILGSGVSIPKRGLLRPHGVCVHNDGSIYVVDSGHDRVIRLQLP